MKSIVFVSYSAVIMGILLAILGLLGYFKPLKPIISTNATPIYSTWREEVKDWNGGTIKIVSYQDPILGEQRHISDIKPSALMGW